MMANISIPVAGEFITSFFRKKQAVVPTAPILDSPVRHSHGPFHFQFSLTEGCPYEIRYSQDLKNWLPLSKGVFSGEKMDYVDSDAPRYNHRFYRVVSGTLSSENILGYATVSIPPRFSMIANPFNSVSNSVAALFPKMKDGTYLSKYDPAQCRLTKNMVVNGRWTNPTETLAPGEGAILFNTMEEFKTLNFVGSVRYGFVSSPIPAGFSIRSSLVPQLGRIDTDLEFPLGEGDSIHLYNRDKQEYEIYDYPSKEWDRNPPVIGIGEAFWAEKNSPGNWKRHVLMPN